MITLVDGSNTVIRLASVARRSGEAGAMVRLVLEFIYWNGVNTDNMVFFWEGNDSTKSKQLINPEYKQGRASIKDEEYFENAFTLTKLILNNLNICNIQVEGCEADDLIGHLTINSDKPIKIISEDHDYTQLLVKPNVCINRPMKKILITDKDVLDVEGIITENYILAKAICGDKSDNIKGVTSVDIPRLSYYFPELCLKKYCADDFLSEISNIEYINENKFVEKRDYNFRCGLIEKIINNEKLLKNNIQLMEMRNIPELEKNKLEYQINKFNDSVKPLDKKVLMNIIAMNQVKFDFRKFQSLYLILTKFSKNKIEF